MLVISLITQWSTLPQYPHNRNIAQLSAQRLHICHDHGHVPQALAAFVTSDPTTSSCAPYSHLGHRCAAWRLASRSSTSLGRRPYRLHMEQIDHLRMRQEPSRLCHGSQRATFHMSLRLLLHEEPTSSSSVWEAWSSS